MLDSDSSAIYEVITHTEFSHMHSYIRKLLSHDGHWLPNTQGFFFPSLMGSANNFPTISTDLLSLQMGTRTLLVL